MYNSIFHSLHMFMSTSILYLSSIHLITFPAVYVFISISNFPSLLLLLVYTYLHLLYLPLSLPVHLYLYLPLSPPDHLLSLSLIPQPVHLYLYISSPPIHLFISTSIFPSIHLFTPPPMHPCLYVTWQAAAGDYSQI